MKQYPKQLLFGSIALIVLAVAVVVGVFVYLQLLLQPLPPETTSLNEPLVTTEPTTDSQVDTGVPNVEDSEIATTPDETSASPEIPPTLPPPLPPAGIPLRDLPLSEAQLSTLATFGIDVETFVLSPSMIACAEQKLGNDRFAAVKTGSAPSFSEALSLVGCITE